MSAFISKKGCHLNKKKGTEEHTEQIHRFICCMSVSIQDKKLHSIFSLLRDDSVNMAKESGRVIINTYLEFALKWCLTSILG